MKKIISLLMVFTLCLTSFPIFAESALMNIYREIDGKILGGYWFEWENVTADGFMYGELREMVMTEQSYYLSDEVIGYEVVGLWNYDNSIVIEEVTVPAYINGLPVISIDWNLGKGGIGFLRIPSTVKGIYRITENYEVYDAENTDWVVKSDYPITTEQKIVGDFVSTEYSTDNYTMKNYKGGNATVITIHFPYNTPVHKIYNGNVYVLNTERYNFIYSGGPVTQEYYLMSRTLGVLVDDDDNITTVILAEADSTPVKIGDVNLDDEVNSLDIIELIKSNNNLTPYQRVAADCYAADGYINVQDLVALVKYCLGEINSLPMYP